jgi:hypothetical protein
MVDPSTNFMRVLSGDLTSSIPLYCTGYPDSEFISRFKTQYPLTSNNNELYLNDLDYSLISSMGFDAISLWGFRRGKGGYYISDDIYVDGWGRKKNKNNWYLWDGIFKTKSVIDSWNNLNLPSRKNFETLSKILHKTKNTIELVLSLPGLFEKTWQSMGFTFFSKMLKKNIEFITYVTNFFLNYLKKLTSELLKNGSVFFLIADDCGYKNRSFIPTSVWKQIFFKPYKDILHLIHEGKGKVILHSDGYITDLIPIFIDLGFDGLQSLEPSAGVDIFQLFKQFSSKICFIGNLDMTLLSFGTQADVKFYVENLINASRKFHAPLIISPTQQLDKSCKPENVKMMIDCTKKFKLDQAHH